MSETAYRSALSAFAALHAAEPENPAYRDGLADTEHNVAMLLDHTGDTAAAEAAYRRALALREALVKDFPATTHYRRDLALHHSNLGTLLKGRGETAAAEAAYRRALELRQRLAADFPETPEHRSGLAASHNSLGNLLAGLGDATAAEAACRRAFELFERLAADFPEVPEYRSGLAASHNNLGTVLDDRGATAAAEAAYLRALDVQEQLAADFPEVVEYQVSLGGSCCNFGHLVVGRQPREALRWYDRAVAVLAGVLERTTRHATARQFLGNSYGGRAYALRLLGRRAAAAGDGLRAATYDAENAAYFRTQAAYDPIGESPPLAVATAERVLAEHEPPAGDRYNLACVFARGVPGEGRWHVGHADQALELLRDLHAEGYFADAENAELLRTDTDLDALRGRADLRALQN